MDIGESLYLAGSIKELEIGWLTGLNVQGEDSDNGGNGDGQEDGSLIFPCLELDDKDDKDIARITSSLCAHCPKLRSLAVNGTIDHGLKAALIRNCAISYLLEIVVSRWIDFSVRYPRLKQVSVGEFYYCETGPAVLDAIRTAAWRGINNLEVLDLDIGGIKETSKRAHASTLQGMFEDGLIMGWHYHAGSSTASYRTDVRMNRAFVEDMIRSVAGLENHRMLRWCMVVFTRSGHPAGARFARLLFVHGHD
ncbi:hypothetical protein EC957_005930 [Mortierella hygrophila]|uniref:Uncharacterized protein n=1 Tax=Mortierella hygrophila TaxID=979708 RepID=A0A9P6K6I1_9FUNG|nr:hypothetical protein EC957_005930 [Mortierella hygrophila]